MIKPSDLRRFWFPADGHIGIGVTGFDLADATRLATAAAIELGWTIDPTNLVGDIDVRNLDQNHVVPNMGVVAFRGVWYPRMDHIR